MVGRQLSKARPHCAHTFPTAQPSHMAGSDPSAQLSSPLLLLGPGEMPAFPLSVPLPSGAHLAHSQDAQTFQLEDGLQAGSVSWARSRTVGLKLMILYFQAKSRWAHLANEMSPAS